MKISKRTREEAALICAIAASSLGLQQSYGPVYRALNGDDAITFGNPAFDLAMAAWLKCQYAWQDGGSVDAEAESLIRSGWSPGDEP